MKNRLARLAAQDAGISVLGAHLTGPTAVAFANEDPIAPAKILDQFIAGGVPPNGTNYPHVRDAALDAAVATALRTEGCDAWKQVQQLALKNYDIVPLAAPIVDYFSRGIELRGGSRTIDIPYLKRLP